MSKTVRLTTEVVLTGLKFPESPRWHDDKLWFVDMDDHKVLTTDMQGHVETILERPNRVSGLDWTPEGKLLVVSMDDNKLFRLDPDGIKEVADLSKFDPFLLNDMVVDKKGRAYIGNFGYDYFNNQPFKHTNLAMVSPNGDMQIVAKKMAFPNGMVITPDDKTLIVAETMAAKLSAFDIQEDGTLVNKRIWANLKSLPPDGICLDEEGGVWLAAPGRHRAVRVVEGGKITHIVKVENDAYACMLGGPDLKTLFIATSAHTRDKGRIEYVKVDIPKAGLP